MRPAPPPRGVTAARYSPEETMRGMRWWWTATMAGALMLIPAMARGQARPQDRMQQHAMRMDEQIQRMDRLRDRLQQMDRQMTQQMDQLRDQDRLRQQQRLQAMCRSLDAAAVQLRQNMQRTREMAGDPAFQHDPELQREMERLREHWQAMATGMEDGYQALERLRQRISQP